MKPKEFARWFFALLTVVLAWAQVIPGPDRPLPVFPPELRAYLELTAEQVESFNAINIEYNQRAIRRLTRANQVQEELREWTAKSPLDPMALGARYLELEALRRDALDDQAKTRDKLRVLLNSQQRTRLARLEEASKLRAVVRQAECENLLAPLLAGADAAAPSTPLPIPGVAFCGPARPDLIEAGIIIPQQARRRGR